MKKHTQINSIDDNVFQKAADWLALMKSGDLTFETEKSFYIWLCESPAHQKAYESIFSIWDDTKFLHTDPLAIEDLKEDWVKEKILTKKNWFHKLKIGIMPHRMIALAATVLFVVAGIWLTLYQKTSTITYATKTGEQKTISLPDGSTLHLDTETVLSIKFTRKLRYVEMTTGRSLFSVAHDSKRPFVVSVGQIVVQAIGTQFNIYKEETGKVSVSVTEGQVKVSLKKEAEMPKNKIVSKNLIKKETSSKKLLTKKTIRQSDFPNEILATGQKIIINEPDADYEIKPVDIELTKEWKEGRLSFYKAPLAEVIEEINRYLDKKIYIEDKRLNDLDISLTFKIAHRHNFVNVLEKAMSIKSRTTFDGKIFISKKE